MTTGWTQTNIVLDGFFDLLTCGKCKHTPERPIRYVTCGHFFCDVCIDGETTCFQCKTPVRPNETQPYRTVAQLIEYCQVIKDVISQTRPNDLKPLAKAIRKFAAECTGLVPETDSETEDEVIESTPPRARRSSEKRNSGEEFSQLSDFKNAGQDREKKESEPETAGYVDPTQLTLGKKKNVEPETAGYVDPTQFSQVDGEKKIESGTVQHADKSQLDKSHQDFEPETLGYLDRTQTPPSRKKKRLLMKSGDVLVRPFDNQEGNKSSMPESFGSYVDPTQMFERNKKFESQPESAGNVDSRRNESGHGKKDVEACGSSAIGGRPPGEREAEEFGRKIADRIDSTQKNRSLDKTAPESESAEFIDPTPCPGRRELSKPGTPGSGDASKSIAIPEKNEERSEALASASRDKLAEKNDEGHTIFAGSLDERVDSSERISDAPESNFLLRKTSKDLLLAPESIVMEPSFSPKVVIPESLQTGENATNNQSTPMETEVVEEESLSRNLIRAENPEDEISDTNVSMICNLTENPVAMRDELSFEESGREANSTIDRRNKNRKNSRERDPSPEYEEMGKKSPEKRLKTYSEASYDENPSLCRDSPLIDDAEIMGQLSGKSIEQASSKHARRSRNLSDVENKISKTDDGALSSPTSTDSCIKTLGRKESFRSTKRIKDFARAGKKSTIGHENRATVVDEIKPSPEKRRSKPLQRLRSVENLDNKKQNKIAAKHSAEKSIKPKRCNNDESRIAVPKAIPKNLNKRNAKGETPLHTACVKGQEDYVKALLKAGSNPNTKDNANWTPLQEAVNLGHREICKMLLQAGALPNIPALDNRTALHDAAAHDKLEEAALLLQFQANKNVYDKFGKKPIDYAVSEEMRSLLAIDDKTERIVDEIMNSTLDQSIIIPNAKVVVLPSNLSNKNRKLLAQLASKLKVEITTTFRPAVTHIVVETNERNTTELSYHVMLAILQGKWILNSQWITISKDLSDISEIDLELFEVRGAPYPGTPMRARLNEERQNPRLFNNCFFYFAIGPRCTWSYEKFEFTKESLTALVLGGQGKILNREPDPEDVKDYRLTPFHVANKPIHPLHRCSHYIIYMPGKDEPRVKYNMPHIKSLPVGWFFESIEKFALVDPVLMGIS